MQQEAVEVLESNAKSKKCNPIEAGLYKLKAWKLDSGILCGGPILPEKLPEKPVTMPIGFEFEEKRIKQQKANKLLGINTLYLCDALPLLYLVRCCGCSPKEGNSTHRPLDSCLCVEEENPNPPKRMRRSSSQE